MKLTPNAKIGLIGFALFVLVFAATIRFVWSEASLAQGQESPAPTATPTPDGTLVNPYDAGMAPIDPTCRIVADDDAAWRHAMAEAWFFGSTIGWDDRSDSFRELVASDDGAEVQYSTAHYGLVTHGTRLVRNRAEYERAIRKPGFLSHAHLNFITRSGDMVNATTFGEGQRGGFPRTGSGAKYIFVHSPELGGRSECFYLYGPGLPPAPTPEPSESEGE